MTDEKTATAVAPLSAATAFVVHLTADLTATAEALHGRVEHVLSGQSLRFSSAADLVRFMQQVLADGTRKETVAADFNISGDE